MTSTSTRDGVIYTRLSSVKPRDKAAGNEDVNVAEQEAKSRTLAGLQAVRVAAGDVFTDNDLTAYKSSTRYRGRDGFDRLLRRLRTGDIGAVFCYHLYRLYRTPSDLDRLIEVCKEHQISIHTVSGMSVDLETSQGVMVAGILAYVAGNEVETTRERAMDGKARLREAGRWPGGRVPYGYRTAGDVSRGTFRVWADEDEARIITGMCADVIAGKSLHEIARGLDAAGVGLPASHPRRRERRPAGGRASAGMLARCTGWSPARGTRRWCRTRGRSSARRPPRRMAAGRRSSAAARTRKCSRRWMTGPSRCRGSAT